ncbi:MAG: hypothetical protein ACRECD_02620 [Burkholderiaceae bacterium]
MRRILLVLIIALLPLRAWVGDVMAMEMTALPLGAMQTIAAGDAQTRAKPGFEQEATAGSSHDCPGHSASADDPAAGSQDVSIDTHCGSCTSCQACHSTAFVNPPALSPAIHSPHVLPIPGSVHFASADPLAGLKPPKA